MRSFFVGFAFFELGVFCGFFAASLMRRHEPEKL